MKTMWKNKKMYAYIYIYTYTYDTKINKALIHVMVNKSVQISP